MKKYKKLVLAVLPSIVFIVILIVDFFTMGYGKKYDGALYFGLIILFLLMTASNEYDSRSGSEGNYFKSGFLLMSFVFGVWLCFDLATKGLNGISGIILIFLSYNTSIFPYVLLEEEHNPPSSEWRSCIKSIFLIFGFFMAIFALFNMYVGEWGWRYYFTSIWIW